MGNRLSYMIWFLVTSSCLLVAALLGILMATSRSSTEPILVVEPAETLVIVDPLKEGDLLRTEYRLSDLSNKIVKIKATLSCNCLISDSLGRNTPFTLRPGEASVLDLRTNAQGSSQHESVITVGILSECEGVDLPMQVLRVRYRAEARIKASPLQISLGGIAPDETIRKTIWLLGRPSAGWSEMPTVIVTGAKGATATIRRHPLEEGPRLGAADHEFDIDVSITPEGVGREDVVGGLSVLDRGIEVARVPIHCSVLPGYSLTPSHIDAFGLPGTVVTRDVYLKIASPVRGDVRIVSSPSFVEASLTKFDASTHKIRLAVNVPTKTDLAFSFEGEMTLVIGDEREIIRLPVSSRRTEDGVKP